MAASTVATKATCPKSAPSHATWTMLSARTTARWVTSATTATPASPTSAATVARRVTATRSARADLFVHFHGSRPVRSLPTISSFTSDVLRPLHALPMCGDLFVHFIASSLAGVPVLYSARPTNGLGVTPIGHPSFLSRIQKSPSESSHWSFRLSTSIHLELAGMQLLAQWMITSAAGQGSSHRRRSARGRRSDLCCLSGKAHPDNRLLIDWR
jgi:hypothetical protein